MAVDSNVLMVERIREELRAGKSSAAALAGGFSNAFATLVDAHLKSA
jgi:preprotein translocase subunit SecD